VNDVELKTLAISWIYQRSRGLKTRPYGISAQEVAKAVGGYAGSVGRVADDVVTELELQGLPIRYVRGARPCRFELLRKAT
jgi:hypothetical protein